MIMTPDMMMREIQQKQLAAKLRKEKHPIAHAIGSMAGSTITMLATGILMSFTMATVVLSCIKFGLWFWSWIN